MEVTERKKKLEEIIGICCNIATQSGPAVLADVKTVAHLGNFIDVEQLDKKSAEDTVNEIFQSCKKQRATLDSYIDSDVEIKCKKLFINNQWHKAIKGKTFPVINPSTGEEICQVEEGTRADVDKAVEAAREAFNVESPWRKLELAARADLMRKLATLIRRDLIYLGKLETLNNGKPLSHSQHDVALSADCIEYYANQVEKMIDKAIPDVNDQRIYTWHEPIGICGQIIPWNLPILMMAWKLGPALACGNVIILKPAEQTPLTALYVASLIKEADFPPGVVNVIPGDGPECGNAIALHQHIDKVAFTGSVEIGKKIQEASAKSNLKRVSLELGEKLSLIICEDADLDHAVTLAHQVVFTNAVQMSTAASQIFVHAKIYDEFITRSVELAKKRVVGDPFAAKTVQGPQINNSQFKKILDYIDSGKNEGATLHCGGKRASNEGYFIEPTIFGDVKDHMKIAREKIFGPVMAVLKFDLYEEVIKRANDTTFGLGAGIITKDFTYGLKLAQQLQADSIWINDFNAIHNQAPFGRFQQPDHGRELERCDLYGYYKIKTVVKPVY